MHECVCTKVDSKFVQICKCNIDIQKGGSVGHIKFHSSHAILGQTTLLRWSQCSAEISDAH